MPDGTDNSLVVSNFFGGQVGASAPAPLISMGSDKPGDADLLAKYMDLRTNTYRQYITHLTNEQQFYRLQFGSEIIPKEWRERGFKVTIPPTAYNAVQAASDHILSKPDIFCPERPISNPQDYMREQVLADLKAQALEYWWTNVETNQDAPFGHGKTNLIRDGKVVLKKEIDFDLIEGGVPTTSYFPWKLSLRSNFTIFEDPNRPYDPRYVFEAYEMRRDSATETFKNASGGWKTKKQASDMVRVVEYWEKPEGTSKGRRVMWVEDERVLNKPNPYFYVCKIDDNGAENYDGYVPYFIADSMWGDGDVHAPAHERYIGIIRYACSVIETEARQLTAGDAQLRVGTFPVIIMTGIEEDDEQPMKVAPGVKLRIEDKDTQAITILEWPKMDPSLFNMIGRVHQYANELAKFESLGGMPQRGVDTATEAQQNFMNASSKLSGPISALRGLMMRINRSTLIDIEHILDVPSGVTMTGIANDMPGAITLTPDDITGNWENFVELQTTDEKALNRQNMQSWLNVFQVMNAQGANIDAEFVMSQAGIKNPKQRRARAKNEKFENDPRTYEVQYAEWLQARGPLGKQLAESIVQQLATGGLPTAEQAPAAPTAPAGNPGAGGFPAVPGQPSDANPGAARQQPAGQDIRATALQQAMDAGVGA